VTQSANNRAETPDEQDVAFDFGGAEFDLDAPRDREILRFILSQALYGEATGVYCGKSLYAAASLEAAHFYVRQAKQELGHLKLFADILRALDLEPSDGHWALKLLSAHNNYYPLKVLLEHAIGEGMVLDVFKDVLLQTLPDEDPRVPPIKKKLEVICREEREHVAWGEKETKRLLLERPYLKPAFFGLVEAQLSVMPLLAQRFTQGYDDHPVLRQLPAFLDHVRQRVYAQGRRLGYVPEQPPGNLTRAAAMASGLLLYARSQLARAHTKLPSNYLRELGFSR
jgi:rubrerythrin